MPKEEFHRRIDALWRCVPRRVARDRVSAARRTTPSWPISPTSCRSSSRRSRSLRATGEHRLFVGGGANMLGAAQPLTFIAEHGAARGG